MKKHKVLWKVLLIVGVVLAALVIGSAIYVNDYYHADQSAIEAMNSNENIEVRQIDNKTYAFVPKSGAKAGFVFYPGGKVDFRAYAPLMQACADQGILCVIKKMPFNLAVLDVNAANGIQEQFPEITDWYIGGHSLGGSMAANYVSKHTDDYKGLVLLGAYSVNALDNCNLSVLSVYGSEDHVMNHEKYQKNMSNLPVDFKEFVIQGGCHAFYGMYGAQKGDGTPTITNEQQIQQTAQIINDMVLSDN